MKTQKEAITTALHNGVIRIVLTYALTSALWILLSDRLLEWLYPSASDLAQASIYKGWFFISVSGLLLFVLLRRLVSKLANSELAKEQLQSEQIQTLQLLSAIADGSEDAIFAKDLQGNYLFFNRTASLWVGKPAADVIGRNDETLFPATQVVQISASDQHVMATGQRQHTNEILNTSRGPRIIQATKGPLYDNTGAITGLFGISRDITEFRDAENLLRISEKRFQDIVNATADSIWELDSSSLFSYLSESTTHLVGYTPDELLGTSPFVLMEDDEANRVRTLYTEIVCQRIPFRDLICQIRHKDGSLRHISTSGTPIFDSDGKLLGYRGLNHDITEDMQVEIRLRHSEARFRTLFETAAVALFIHHPTSGQILDANQKALELNGCSSLEELQGNQFWLAPPYSFKDAQEKIHAAAQEGEQRFEWKIRGHNRIETWAEVQLNLIKLNDMDCILAIVIDISQRKMAKEALQLKTAELTHRNAELERFNHAFIGRELEMIELKKQVNQLAHELGQAPPHSLSFLETNQAKRGSQ